jgi:hypothetical protein
VKERETEKNEKWVSHRQLEELLEMNGLRALEKE